MGHEVVVIAPTRNKVVPVLIELVDRGAARLDFPVQDLVVGPAGPEDARVRKARGAAVGVLTRRSAEDGAGGAARRPGAGAGVSRRS
jgi:hypothetical protein